MKSSAIVLTIYFL